MLLLIMLVIFTASQDYDSGPKHVIFKRYSRTAVLSIHIKPDQNETYTGNRVFSLFINSGGLPTGLVPGNIVQATVIIIDNECKCIIYVLKVLWLYVCANVN